MTAAAIIGASFLGAIIRWGRGVAGAAQDRRQWHCYTGPVQANEGFVRRLFSGRDWEVAASTSEPFEGLAYSGNEGLLGGFLDLASGAVEIAGDHLDAAIEVMFEQFYRALDVAFFNGSQQIPVIFLGQLAQAHRLEVEAQEAFFLVLPVFDQS